MKNASLTALKIATCVFAALNAAFCGLMIWLYVQASGGDMFFPAEYSFVPITLIAFDAAYAVCLAAYFVVRKIKK